MEDYFAVVLLGLVLSLAAILVPITLPFYIVGKCFWFLVENSESNEFPVHQ